MSDGWIKLHRSIIKKAYFKDPDKLALWILLLIKANHFEREEMLGGKKIVCQPGQFTTGRKQLAELVGFSENKIERHLTYFEKTEQQIRQQKTNKNRLISVVNWSEYQHIEQQNRQQIDNKWTTNRHTVRSKEYKEDIVKLNEINEKKIDGGVSAGEALFAAKYGNEFPEINYGAKNDMDSKK